MTREELLAIIDQAAREGTTELDLSGRGISELPDEIGQLTNLNRLNLYHNEFSSLPEAILRLPKLRELGIGYNPSSILYTNILKLNNLTSIGLEGLKMTTIPPQISQLSKLEELWLGDNALTDLPEEIMQLTNLQMLSLYRNKLTSLPESISQLTNLQTLYLYNNQLTSLPTSIGQLTNLQRLYLDTNQLTSLPPSLARLEKLETLELYVNPLTSPPPEIVEQGVQAVLAYLREQLEAGRRQWLSKLLVVGEGGVGKTALLLALRGEPFEPQLASTHGIRIETLELAHPSEDGVAMELNAWDFGGQEIYHATHQFFLTNRSLFVLAWNARHGYEQGKLYYWLDAIQARAPESPVILVATHLDQRDADLPLADLQKKYPQIAGHCEISNKTGEGSGNCAPR